MSRVDRQSFRRGAAAALLALMFAGMARADSLWREFVKTFVTSEGRVVDTGNGRISHSEGQGYGMILAVAHGDRDTFERIWKWTRSNLQVRNDALLAWKWEPRGRRGVVTDMNNATDGDLLVAWALFRAAARWEVESFREEGQKIIADVLKLAVVPSAFGPVLLPGVEGFKRSDGLVVNLSYWVFPAFRVFAKEDRDTDWMAIAASGRRLLEAAKFGRWGLPPEWLLVRENGVALPGDFPPEFGYNAIRIPMHLVWDAVTAGGNFASYREYASSFPTIEEVKATVNLVTNLPGNDPVLPGMAGIYRLIGRSGPAGASAPTGSGDLSNQSYFSAALTLLGRLAWEEGAASAAEAEKGTHP